MIKSECFTRQWCEHVAQRLNYNDIQLIEKVVRALSLLEMLVKSGCPFHFKGGTATMLLLGGATNRLSIDIDIICPPGTEIVSYLSDFKDFGFTKIDLVERKSPGKNIPKSHSKFFYQLRFVVEEGNPIGRAAAPVGIRISSELIEITLGDSDLNICSPGNCYTFPESTWLTAHL